MALGPDRAIYGIHSMTPRNIVTGKPYGIMKVLGDAQIEYAMTSEQLRGGSNKAPIKSEVSSIETSFNCSVKTLPDFMLELWGGGSLTTVAASTTGTVGTITNKSGTSAVSASAGIASVALKSSGEASLKFGRYFVLVVTPTTVDIYVDTDVNFKSKGTQVSFVDDLLKVTSTPLTVPDASTVELAGFEIELTGGTTVAMTTGDTAYFDVYPVHEGVSKIIMGQTPLVLPDFELAIYAQTMSDLSEFKIEVWRASATSGLIIPLPEGGYSIPDLSVSLLYDNCMESVFEITAINGQAACS